MPVKTCQCALCGKTVSRRSTLSLENIGGGEGRACREHEEVINLLSSKEKQQKWEKESREAIQILQAFSLAAAVRAMHTFQGIPPEVIYFRVKRNGMPVEVIDRAKKLVADQGGPLMTTKEVEEAVIGAAFLRIHHRETQAKMESASAH